MPTERDFREEVKAAQDAGDTWVCTCIACDAVVAEEIPYTPAWTRAVRDHWVSVHPKEYSDADL